MIVDVATLVAELADWCTPRTHIWTAGGDVGGDAATREGIYADGLGRPLHGEDAATDGVKACAVGIGVRVADGAAGVGGLARCVSVAVCG